MSQDQFLNVINRDEAERRFRSALKLVPCGEEQVDLAQALGRTLSHDVLAPVDVPCFDRSNFDGYALRAEETFGASELQPRSLKVHAQSLEAGRQADFELIPGFAVSIATGGMIPRGADAVLMVEHADTENDLLMIRRSVTPGHGIAFAGTDIAMGETVLRQGTSLTSRETGVLAAIGVSVVSVWRKPRVAIFSTGNEIVAPGQPIRPSQVYDSNARILSDAVRELGCEPVLGGILQDNEEALRTAMLLALREADVILLSGGTSKGQGDLCYRIVSELKNPGIVVHGVALKPGKPLCLAVTEGKPVVVLPGFPTSAIFTFHEFVAPVLRLLAGRSADPVESCDATLAVRVNSEIGRTEYLLVGLVETSSGHTAFPMGKGSGSVTAFSRADGFIAIGRNEEIVEVGTRFRVQLIGLGRKPADLVVIGSHCVGLDLLLTELERKGFSTKLLTVGSTAGLAAVRRGECDLAGVHLLDVETGVYNSPFVTPPLFLIPGYTRWQGFVFRAADPRFSGLNVSEILKTAIGQPGCVMVNRNPGSGTRILLDQLLNGRKPPGYAVQPGNHNAVTAAILQKRADWGMAIESVAARPELDFIRVTQEHFDFVVHPDRRQKPGVIQPFKSVCEHAFVKSCKSRQTDS